MSAAGPAPASAASDPGLAYLGALRGSFEQAALATGGTLERDLELGGIRVRLRFAGDALAGLLLPPLAHLEVARADEPELKIDVFDTASTGVEPPPLPWRPAEPTAGTYPVSRFESERACLLAAATTGALTAADPTSGLAVFHLPDATGLPGHERAAPLREAIHLLMAPRGRWMTHAAAVGCDGRGVLLVGRGGSGKSTLALSCALAGMEFVADDYVLLETGPPIAHALQSTAKLTEDSAARLGIAAEAVDPAGFEPTIEGPPKALVDVRALVPGSMRRRLEIGAVVAPTLSGVAEPARRPISAAQALRALAPSTVLQMRSRNSPLLGGLAELVREAPALELRLCPDPIANAAAVEELVGDLG